MTGIRFVSTIPVSDTDPASTDDAVLVRQVGVTGAGSGATAANQLTEIAALGARIVQVVPTVDATACAQFDVWAATEVLTGAARAADVPCCLRRIKAVRLDAATGLFFRVWLLSKNSSIGAENAAFAPADADADDLIGYVDFAVADFAVTTGMTCAFAQSQTLEMWCQPATGTANLYFGIQVLDAAGIDVGAATDLILTFDFI
jgi:hypothetical protein